MKKTLRLFAEAFRGHERDYTSISVNKAIFLLSVPMVVEMIGESLFALVDAFFVSKYIGVDALATVALTESVLSIIYSIAIGLSAAATAMVARRIGEKNHAQAGLVVSQIILISIVFSVIIGVLGFVFAPQILGLMGAEAAVIESGSGFTRVVFLSSPAIILLWTLGGALRGAGDATSAMKSLLLANAINIVLDGFFIVFMHTGVIGAAYATSIGRTIGVLFQVYVLFKGNGNIKVTAAQFVPNWTVIKELLQIAAGGTGQFLIQSSSWIFLTRILASFGSPVLAGYNIAIRVIIFTILPSWGMANAAATLVGQNLGANRPDRAESSVWRTSFYNMIFMGLVAILFFIFAEEAILIFNNESTNAKDLALVVATGVSCLKIICLGYLAFAYGMVISQSLNGAGDTRTPTIINLICFWAIEIPLAYFLAKTLNWGPDGVFWAIAISESILAVIAIFVFRKGRWKTMKL